MTYVISDIHDCYQEYLEALSVIGFDEDDVLYVVGDCVDRGPEPIRLLLDMMCRPNVIPLMGNHDLTALTILRRLCVEITEENYDTAIDVELLEAMADWQVDGGKTTLEGFRKLSYENKMDVLDYLSEFSIFEEIEAAGKTYLMVHGGLEPFEPGKEVEDYDISQLLLSKPDYDREYFSEKYTITGHTPTVCEQGNSGTVIRRNNHIAIDCGCIYGYNLGVLCLETGKEFYVKGRTGNLSATETSACVQASNML